jgi:hypothetical protein
LVNKGLIPPFSPLIKPLTGYPERSRALFPPHSETFFPDDKASLQRNSTYIRHIQSELNLHSLKHEINKAQTRVAPAPKGRRGGVHQSVPLTVGHAVNEGRPAELEVMRSRPQAITRHTTSIGSISEFLHAPPPTPITTPHAIYSTPNFAMSDSFVQRNCRNSLHPVAVPIYNTPSTDSLRAYPFSHCRSFSVPASPAFSASTTTLHAIPEGEVPQWPHGRYYANVNLRKGSDAGTIERRVKSRQRFGKFVRKVSGLFSRRR